MTDASCNDCPLHTRRDFMRDAGQAVALTLAASSLFPRSALAAPRFIAALAANGREVRYGLPAVDCVSIDADNEVILARTANRVFAFSLACPHQRTALRWEDANDRFRCPKHKSIFRPDGALVEGKATRPMDRFAIRRDGDAVFVATGAVLRFDRDRAEWEAAVVEVSEK